MKFKNYSVNILLDKLGVTTDNREDLKTTQLIFYFLINDFTPSLFLFKNYSVNILQVSDPIREQLEY